MTKYGSVRILDSPEQSAHGLFFGHLKVAVDAGDHQIECAEDVIGIIQCPVVQDITFDAFEDGKGCQFPVQLFDLRMLFPDAVFLEAIGVEGAFAMVADHEVFIPLFDAGCGHFLERVRSVGPVAMGMDDGLDIARLDNRADRRRLAVSLFTSLFPAPGSRCRATSGCCCCATAGCLCCAAAGCLCCAAAGCLCCVAAGSRWNDLLPAE